MTMVLAAIDPGVITALVVAVLGGGFLTGIAIFRKSGPEAEQIVAATLIEVNEHLRKELDERDKRWAEEVKRREEEIERLRDEVSRLRLRLQEVQQDLQKVEDELSQVGRPSTPPSPSK